MLISKNIDVNLDALDLMFMLKDKEYKAIVNQYQKNFYRLHQHFWRNTNVRRHICNFDVGKDGLGKFR